MSLPPITSPTLVSVVNVEVLYHVVLESLGSGSLIGVGVEVATAVLAHASTIFGPSVLSMATLILTLILDVLRSHLPTVQPTG